MAGGVRGDCCQQFDGWRIHPLTVFEYKDQGSSLRQLCEEGGDGQEQIGLAPVFDASVEGTPRCSCRCLLLSGPRLLPRSRHLPQTAGRGLPFRRALRQPCEDSTAIRRMGWRHFG